MPSVSERVSDQVEQLIEPILDDMNIELVDIEYLSERGRWVLRIYADREGGITLEDCARVSREIGDVIDMSGILSHEYVLEVSSPGIDRPLKKEADFFRSVGRKIRVRTRNPVQGRRNFTGRLRAFRDGVLYLRLNDGELPLELRNVEKANLVYEFGDER
jgi:ribosome maturation factor RimP